MTLSFVRSFVRSRALALDLALALRLALGLDLDLDLDLDLEFGVWIWSLEFGGNHSLTHSLSLSLSRHPLSVCCLSFFLSPVQYVLHISHSPCHPLRIT